MKDVSKALDAVLKILRQLGDANALDEKLAEYAFFPFTHIFNEAQKLSSRCLESAVDSVSILVSKGWRQHLAPEMGKQLLILMTLVAGADSKKQLEPPSEELKAAAFQCIDLLIRQMTRRLDASRLFDVVGSRSIVDQLAYLLLESVTEESSAQVQLTAAEALLTLVSTISSRVLLASLLPRTASSLTQSLRGSIKARRGRKILISNLRLLTSILRAVLADAVVYPLPIADANSRDDTSASEALDDSWLRATATQVGLVIVQVVRLCNHEHGDVRHAVADLCLVVVTECAKSLSESLPVAVETVAAVAQYDDGSHVVAKLENATISNAELSDILSTKLRDWMQSLPRIMQANDEQTKQRLLGQIRIAITVAAQGSRISKDILATMASKTLEAVAVSDGIGRTRPRPLLESSQPGPVSLEVEAVKSCSTFSPLVMTHTAQSQSLVQLEQLLDTAQQTGVSGDIARLIIDRIPELDTIEKISGTWLVIRCLETDEGLQTSILDTLDAGTDDLSTSRPRLISELYSALLPYLMDASSIDPETDWRLTALAIEATVMQAVQLDTSYRPELMDTLYPILSLLGSTESPLRNHAMTGLNLLATACKYSSTADMLIDNVDYLINSVGMKLNSFDVSPQAPQVLLMMLRLCGARIIPFIDDLIGSVFSALDNFHGYSNLVELLFQVLQVIVDETKHQPQLVIANGQSGPDHQMTMDRSSRVTDIENDLLKRKSRKRKIRATDEDAGRAPHRPWKSFESEMEDLEKKNAKGDEQQEGEETSQLTTEDGKHQLSKPHQLLLSIASSATPHLTSPSPRVRSILLHMLDEISPLLAQDEDSFLPLINTIWPSVVPRLLDYHDSSSTTETTYNICAAADTISALCRGAGSFMSGRTDDIFPKVQKLFEQVQGDAKVGSNLPPSKTPSKAVAAVVTDTLSTTSTSKNLIVAALVRLLTAILLHVKVSQDIGDEIMALLGPYSISAAHPNVRDALQTYNPDSFWLWRQLYGNAPNSDSAGPT